MTDLTEKWKKGELKSGWYYVYLKYLGMFDITTSSTLFGILERGNENCLEILAHVPSYQEWQAKDKENQQLKTQIAKLTEIVGVLPLNHSVSNLGYKIKNQRHEINNRIKEIDKLKELLRECKRYIDFWGYTDSHGNFLYPQIDKAIGE